MGQYYRAIFINENQKPITSIVSYDFGSGAKLMEHSWLKNPFVRFVERQLMITPQRIVWGGDYADNEDPSTLTPLEIKGLADDDSEYTNTQKIKENGANLYDLSHLVGKLTHDISSKGDDREKEFARVISPNNAKYLVNHTKQEFIDKSKTPKDADGWCIHPLPLMTCEGNGRGGGDFRGDDKLVGIWARDLIGATTKKSDIPKGFKEIIFDLKE